jgi:hypothetical protein
LRQIQHANNILTAPPVFAGQMPHDVNARRVAQRGKLAAEQIRLGLKGDIHRDLTIYVWEVGDKGKEEKGMDRRSLFAVRISNHDQRISTTALLHHHIFFLLVCNAFEISGVTGFGADRNCKNLPGKYAVWIGNLRDIGVENR